MPAAEQLITDNLAIWSSVVKNKSAAGRGKSNKLELYGIKKLRQLILELAVRGLLIPQDPNDEPASELLKIIAAEKAKLVKDGKIKKPKKLLPIEGDEQPFDLPAGWSLARLGDLTHMISKGTTPTSVGYTFEEAGISFIKIENLDRGRIDKGSISQFISEETNSALARSQLNAGDLLFSIAGTIGKTAIVYEDDLPANTNQALAFLRGSGVVFSPSFLRIQLDSFVAEKTRQRARGGAMPNVSLGDLTVLVSPIPPLSEQHRIVAKVDELMALCDQLEQQQETSITAHQTLVQTLLDVLTTASERDGFTAAWARVADHFDTLFTTEWSIDQLKQTILQLAVMGKLVPQDPNDEPASELLKKIAAEKAKLVKDGKIKKQKPLAPIDTNEQLFDLPDGWEWCRLDELSLSSEAGWSPRCASTPREKNEWGVLKVSAVTWGVYQPDENKALPQELEPREQFEVQDGDFLISRANTADLVARAVIVPENSPKHLMMSDKIIRFSLSNVISGLFVSLVNNSSLSRSYYASVAGGTSSSMKNVSRDKIRNLVIGLPPMYEQDRIVVKVDELMALCETLKDRIQTAQAGQVHLADAAVEQAVA